MSDKKITIFVKDTDLDNTTIALELLNALDNHYEFDDNLCITRIKIGKELDLKIVSDEDDDDG